MQHIRVLNIICILLLFSSTLIVVLLVTSESPATAEVQISAISLEAGVLINQSSTTLKLLFLTVLLCLTPRLHTVVSSVLTSKSFMRHTIYLFKLRGLLHPVKFQSKFIV